MFLDWEESNCQHYTYSDARFDDGRKLTRAQLTAHTNKPQRLVWRSHQTAMWKTVRWSLVYLRGKKEKETERLPLSSDSYGSHLVDGLMEQRRDSDRQRQTEKDAQVLENETSSLLICRGGLVSRVTFSINCARILSQWNMSWVSTFAASGSSLHIWSRNRLAKQTWLIWKEYFICSLESLHKAVV